MNSKAIIFIGPQGSGKGTQAKLLADKVAGAVYVESGGLLREAALQDTELAKHIKSLIDQGHLVPDEDIEQLVSQKLVGVPADQAVIFDGLPRRIGQAEFLLQILQQTNRAELSATIYISLDRAESIKRLSARRICTDCKVSAIANGDPNQVCQRCGGKLIVRADDVSVEAINKRLDAYEQETKPLLEFLRQHTKFFEINGNQPIAAVSADIAKVLNI